MELTTEQRNHIADRDNLVSLIAKNCHRVNTAYCATLGDFSHLPWNELDRMMQKGIEAGVRFYLRRPGASAEEMHKTHPNLIAYANLSEKELTKDVLFQATVITNAELIGDFMFPKMVPVGKLPDGRLVVKFNQERLEELASMNDGSSGLGDDMDDYVGMDKGRKILERRLEEINSRVGNKFPKPAMGKSVEEIVSAQATDQSLNHVYGAENVDTSPIKNG